LCIERDAELLSIISNRARHIMTVAGETILNRSKQAGRNFDRRFVFSYAVFAIVFVALIFAASTSPGTASGEIASMSVFP
jgi:uncharacterized membrane protein